MSEFCVVTTTMPNQQEATALAQKIVEQQLAACVQMMPINSVYRWEGTIQNELEVLLLIKTRTALYGEVEAFITAHHSYSVPEIIQLSIEQGSAAYLQWLAAAVPPLLQT